MTTARNLSEPSVPMWLLVLAAAAYLLVPGVDGVPLNGIPIGQAGIVAMVALIGVWLWTRRSLQRAPALYFGAIVAAVVVKIAVGATVPATGWLAQYYANESFTGAAEASIDFRGLNATRIDRRLVFEETEFPVHFFNNREYNTGVFREWSLPYSVRWTGHVASERDRAISLRLSARGRAELLIDGVTQGQVAGSGAEIATATVPVALPSGAHRLEVRYQKPAETAGLLRLEELNGDVLGLVSPREGVAPSAMWRTAGMALGWLLHLVVAVAAAAAFLPGIRAQHGVRLVPAAVVVMLVGQGLWKARHLVDRVWTMSGGDDWLNYEMSARDVVLHGLMMSQGGVIGRGQPFSLYPGYAYWVALVHAVTGESLAGVVLMNFVLLAVATLIAFYIGRRLFGIVPALGGLAWLLAIEQADFVRYYTVTLFSENLYFVLAAATVWFLMEHQSGGRRRDLVAAGIAGALASWTRPSMMLLLPLAAAMIGLARFRFDGLRKVAVNVVLFIAAWMAAIAPITLRNYVMSGNPVLLTSGQGASFVAYNMPVDDKMYFEGFDGTLFNAATILIKMFIDHPLTSMANYGRKLGFSLGMVHWLGGSGTVHPELIVTSIGFFAALVLLKPLRSLAAWPIHAFLVTHIATLMLTMPSNYGYRMILPSFLFMSIAAGAVAIAPLIRAAAARVPVLRTALDGAAQ